MKENKLLCGYAQVDITPKRPVYLDGFAARSTPSVGVRDPLYLKVLSLKDAGGEECLILVFDILGFDKYLHEKIRAAALEASDLPDEKVMILATHTHSGLASGGLYALPKDEEHWDDVIKMLKNAIKEARSNGTEASPVLDETEISIGINRRVIVDGNVIIGENPDKMRDDSLRVLRFVSDDKILGALCNTSCHPVNLSAKNMRVSADYPSYLHKYANDKEDLFALFTQSACGNINPIRRFEDSEENLLENGGRLVKAFEEVLSEEPVLSSDKLSVSCLAKDIILPIAFVYDEETLKDKYNYWNKRVNDPDPNTAYRATVYSHWYEIQLAELEATDKPSVTVRVRLFSIGNCAILSLPFETFVETRKALCDAYEVLTGKKLIVCGCSDRVFAYLPDPLSLFEGGYETEGACAWYAVPGKYTPDSEPTLVAKCKELFVESVK